MRKIDLVLIFFVVAVAAFAVVIGLALADSEIVSGLLSNNPQTTISGLDNEMPESEDSVSLAAKGEPKIIGPAELSTEKAIDILEAYFGLYPDENRDASIYVIKCYENFDGTYVVSINLDPEKRTDDEVNETFDVNKTFRLDGCTFIDQDLIVYKEGVTKTLKRAYHDEWLSRDEYLHIYDMYRQEYSSYYTLNHTLTEAELNQINTAWKKRHAGFAFANSLDEIGEPGEKIFYGKYGECLVFYLRDPEAKSSRDIRVGGIFFTINESASEFVVFHDSQEYTLLKAYQTGLLKQSDLIKIRAEHEKWSC
jgi:hypothetical protein